MPPLPVDIKEELEVYIQGVEEIVNQIEILEGADQDVRVQLALTKLQEAMFWLTRAI